MGALDETEVRARILNKDRSLNEHFLNVRFTKRGLDHFIHKESPYHLECNIPIVAENGSYNLNFSETFCTNGDKLYNQIQDLADKLKINLRELKEKAVPCIESALDSEPKMIEIGETFFIFLKKEHTGNTSYPKIHTAGTCYRIGRPGAASKRCDV